MELIAHRGLSARAPENTLAALRLALDERADGVEWDVQASADGVPILLHDDTLDRTTDGSGRAGGYTLAELRSLDAGSWFDSSYGGQPIPSLAEALALTAGRCERIYPELKAGMGGPVIERVVDEIAAAGWSEGATVISLDWDALAEVRRRSGLRIGFIVERAEDFERAVDLARGDGNAIVDPDRRVLLADPAKAALATSEGVPLASWTVNDPDEAAALLAMGVRGLTTDDVGALRAGVEGA
ncbi:MAG TPA: glycerophosphodiester phosphodiesterase family protein [Longimicrobiales bacterium]|nr:glycerophosphodiester phosphodiesterase family protein [Longimicrobiales bacterium]